MHSIIARLGLTSRKCIALFAVFALAVFYLIGSPPALAQEDASMTTASPEVAVTESATAETTEVAEEAAVDTTETTDQPQATEPAPVPTAEPEVQTAPVNDESPDETTAPAEEESSGTSPPADETYMTDPWGTWTITPSEYEDEAGMCFVTGISSTLEGYGHGRVDVYVDRDGVEQYIPAAMEAGETAVVRGFEVFAGNSFTVSTWHSQLGEVHAPRTYTVTAEDCPPGQPDPEPDPNQPPTVDDLTVNAEVGQTVEFTVTASDPDGDTLTYELDNPSNGTVTGDGPTFEFTASQAGTAMSTVTVSDGTDTDSATVTFVVVEPDNPGDPGGPGSDAEKNHPEYWENLYPGTSCEKFEPVGTPFTVPAPDEGTEWVRAIVKAGSRQSVDNPNEVVEPIVAGQQLAHSSGKDNSHVILCSQPIDEEEDPVVIDVPTQPAVNDPCGLDNASWIVPDDDEMFNWEVDEEGNLIVTIVAENTEFPNGKTSHDYGTAPDSGELCPVDPEPEPAGELVVTTSCYTIDVSTNGIMPEDASVEIQVNEEVVETFPFIGVSGQEYVVDLYVDGKLVDSETVTLEDCGPVVGPPAEHFTLEVFYPDCIWPDFFVVVHPDGEVEAAVELQRELADGAWETVASATVTNMPVELSSGDLNVGEVATFRVVAMYPERPDLVTELYVSEPVSLPTAEECGEVFPPELPEGERTVAESSECGVVSFFNRADVEVTVMYGSFENYEPDDMATIAPGESYAVETERTQLDWVSYVTDTFAFAGEGSVAVKQDCEPGEPSEPKPPVNPGEPKPPVNPGEPVDPPRSWTPDKPADTPSNGDKSDGKVKVIVKPVNVVKGTVPATAPTRKGTGANTGLEMMTSSANHSLAMTLAMMTVAFGAGLVLTVRRRTN